MSSQRIRHDWATELNWTENELKLDLICAQGLLSTCQGVGMEKRWEGQNVEPGSAVILKAAASKRPNSNWSGYQDTPLGWCLSSWNLHGEFGGWVSSSHTASPLKLSGEPITIFQSHLWGSNLVPKPLLWMASLHFLQLLLGQAVSFVVSPPLCQRPFATGCFRETWKQFSCCLSRQQALLTSLCSYLVTCCQLLSAQSQLRRILLQWVTNLQKAKLTF